MTKLNVLINVNDLIAKVGYETGSESLIDLFVFQGDHSKVMASCRSPARILSLLCSRATVRCHFGRSSEPLIGSSTRLNTTKILFNQTLAEPRRSLSTSIRLSSSFPSSTPNSTPSPSSHQPPRKVTIQTLRKLYREKEPISVMTAHDYPSGSFVDKAGIEICLVGDSLAMVALGHDSTNRVTMDVCR